MGTEVMGGQVAAAASMDPKGAGTELIVTLVILGTDCAHLAPKCPKYSFWLAAKERVGSGRVLGH